MLFQKSQPVIETGRELSQFDWQFQMEANRSCQKDVKKLPKTNKNNPKWQR